MINLQIRLFNRKFVKIIDFLHVFQYYLPKARQRVLKKLYFTNMSKIIGFFREVKAELWKVVWPSRSDVVRYTVTVIIFSLVVAAILGAADYGLLKGFQALINN